MATKKTAATVVADEPADSRGNVRVYADVPRELGKDFTIFCVRRGVSKRAMMASLIVNALKGK